MTTTSLHAPPSAGAFVREQLRAVRIGVRKELIAFILFCLASFIVVLGLVLRTHHGSEAGHVSIGPEVGIPTTIVAMLMPFAVWRGEDRAHRAYHWVMPVHRVANTFSKVLGGLVWVTAITAIWLVMILAMFAVLSMLPNVDFQLRTNAWYWLVPFTSSAVAYLATTAVIVGTRHAGRWLAGAVVGYWLLVGLTSTHFFDLYPLQRLLVSVWSGYAGVSAAVFGSVHMMDDWLNHGPPDATRWLVTAAIWLAAEVAAIWLGSRRSPG